MVKLWDLRKMKNFHTITPQVGQPIRSVSFDHSGQYLAAAGSDVWVYHGKQFSLVKTFSDHKDCVTGVRFGKDAQFLVTSSMDRSLKIFGTVQKQL